MSQLEQVAQFKTSMMTAKASYNIDISAETATKLVSYYELLLRWNERLHLVAPCSPDAFATRHVLESLILINYIYQDARVIDVGSGAGLPIIPCLIARPDITATLVESSQKKSVFLREALKVVGALKRTTIIPKPFDEITPPDADFVTCRALDDFSAKVRLLFQWAPQGSTLLLYGGQNLFRSLKELGVEFRELLLPSSENRFLFELKKTNRDF